MQNRFPRNRQNDLQMLEDILTYLHTSTVTTLDASQQTTQALLFYCITAHSVRDYQIGHSLQLDSIRFALENKVWTMIDFVASWRV